MTKDTDDGRSVYDVEFATASTEYDYEIDASTGNILKRESEPINTPVNPQPTDIGEAAAKAAALKDAGIGEADLTYIKVKRDTDDGRTVYDVEFATATAEYNYEIDASTGDILKRESEPIATQPVNPQPVDIGEDAAKAAALERARVNETDYRVMWLKVQKDYEDGRAVWELEFIAEDASGGTEYDCEIDAATGQVLKFESERVTFNDPAPGGDTGPSPAGDIGAEAAKAAALAHAGLDASQVSGMKCERDLDDGRLEYEIEFRSGGYEYEYTVDGTTGAILDHERDLDD